MRATSVAKDDQGKLMGKRIAITGASGYIGQLLIERLAEKPEVEKIIALDLKPPNPLPEKTEFIACDVRDPKLGDHLAGAEIVVHLAFIVSPIHDLDSTYDINLRGTRNLLAAVEKTRPGKLVVASSVAAYGIQPRSVELIDEATPLRGDSSSYYNHSKRLVEEHLDIFEKRNPDIILTRLRPSILLGPRNNNFAHEIGRLPSGLRVREGLFLPVVHEDDVIEAFELAVERDAPGPFIISLTEPVGFEDFETGKTGMTITVSINTLLRLSRIFYPLRLTKFSPDWIISAKTRWKFDISRAREILGWEPKHDLKTTIAQMMENIEQNKWRRRLWSRFV